MFSNTLRQNTPRKLCLYLALCFALALTAIPALASEVDQFRGPDRNGKFAAEGLLDKWPEGGPAMLWSTEGLGESYATLSFGDDRMYTTGVVKEQGHAFALDLSGKQLWSVPYGPVHPGNGYPGTRTTPTFSDGKIFLLSSMGLAVALDASTGEKVWSKNLLEEFGGPNLYFGISESPLVDGDRVIFTPGGKDATLVALDKNTGKLVWKTEGLEDSSAYCNPRILEVGDHRQIVTLVQKHMIGVDPEKGTLLWKAPYPARYDIHAVSPVFDGKRLYVSDGYNQGGRMFELAADGRSVKEVWKEEKLDVHHGGSVLLDGRIYGAASKGAWFVLDGSNGEILAEIPRVGKGAVVYADGLLYGYTEKGEVVLVNPDPKDFRVISSFEIEMGSGQHWSHPVIREGVLYIRHGEALMAFDIAAKADAGGSADTAEGR